MRVLADRAGGPGLQPAARDRLARHAERALTAARGSAGEAVAAVTVRLDGDIDPAAVAFSSRRPDEPLFVLEQPDAGGSAIAALGCVRAIEATGPARFAEAARAWRGLAARASADPSIGIAGSGLVALGGFAFADDGGASAHWSGFAPASLHVPEVAIARRDGVAALTLAVLACPDDTVEDLLERADARAAELRAGPMPLLDPSPMERPRIASAMPPEHYVGAVERAVERIRAGELEKIVLAREVLVRATGFDAAAIHDALRGAFPACLSYCVARGTRVLIGSTPELLVRRQGTRASTLALAGTTVRSADPAVDDHLGEQMLRSPKDAQEHAIVVRRIVRALAPHSVWVTPADEPVVVRIANVQHLATPIRAQLREPMDLLELAAVLHPTPAVGGEPADRARAMIPALEGFDRGWYAGPLGWTDRDGDGELCVALRCALIGGGEARCFAGVGVVAGSDPAAELAETEAKLQALLPVLT